MGYIYILPSEVGILKSHHKDPDQPTSIVQCHKGFEHSHIPCRTNLSWKPKRPRCLNYTQICWIKLACRTLYHRLTQKLQRQSERWYTLVNIAGCKMDRQWRCNSYWTWGYSSNRYVSLPGGTWHILGDRLIPWTLLWVDRGILHVYNPQKVGNF